MKFLECPHCGKQAVKIWEIFVFPSPFWLSKRCKHCNIKIRLNFKTIAQILICMVLAIILGNIVIRLLSINSALFEAILLFGFICLPLLLGGKLFLSHDEEQNNKSMNERTDQ